MLSSLLRRAHITKRSLRSFSVAFGKESLEAGKVFRFQDITGEEKWGVFSDVSETRGYALQKREGGGKWEMDSSPTDIHLILPPVDPPAVFGVGLNYADHATEVKLQPSTSPAVFMKPPTALTGHLSPIILPSIAPGEVDYEGELAILIGRPAKNISEKEALEYVLGYTIANDVTARKWQKKAGQQWVRGKSFDTFLPLGPYVIPKNKIEDPQNLKIQTWVNDTLCQDSSTSLMLHPITFLISYLSQGTTLLPGTVILTGTPAGVGYVHKKYLKPGDIIRISIEGLGMLINPVVEEL